MKLKVIYYELLIHTNFIKDISYCCFRLRLLVFCASVGDTEAGKVESSRGEKAKATRMPAWQR